MRRRRWFILGGLILLFCLIIGGLQWWKYHNFGYNGLDLAIYSQVTWSLAHGHGFASSIHDPSYLGDHLELGLLLLAPIYRIFSSPLTLLWAQTIILGLSGLLVASLARRFLPGRWWWLAVILWLGHPLMYNAAMYEFHGLVFVLPLLLGAILAYLNRRLWWWLGLLFAVVLIREDMPLVVAGFALLAAIDRRGWRWWAPASIIALGWYLIAQQIIAASGPLGNYKYFAFYQWLGQGYQDYLTFPFRHPLIFLQHVFAPNNWQKVLGLLIGFGFLPLFRPRLLWPTVFIFATTVLHGTAARSFLRLHYVIPYLPFLAWAALTALADFRRGVIWSRWSREIIMPLVVALAIVGPLYGYLVYGPAIWPWRPFTETGISSSAVLRQALTLVEPTDRVIATFNVLPNLSNRPTVYSLNYVYLGRRQYTENPYQVPTPIDVAIIDWQQFYQYQFLYRQTLYQNQTGPQRIQRLLNDNDLRLAWWVDSVAVYTRSGTSDYQPTTAYPLSSDGSRFENVQLTSLPEVGTAIKTRAGDRLITELPIQLAWRISKKSDWPWTIRFRLNRNGVSDWTTVRLLGEGASPTTEWQPGLEYVTRYRLQVPATLRSDYQLRAEVLDLRGRYHLDRWQQFIPMIDQTTVLYSTDLGLVAL